MIKYAKETCEFYLLESRADNYTVREATCHCISEICTKVAIDNREPFSPYSLDLLK